MYIYDNPENNNNNLSPEQITARNQIGIGLFAVVIGFVGYYFASKLISPIYNNLTGIITGVGGTTIFLGMLASNSSSKSDGK